MNADKTVVFMLRVIISLAIKRAAAMILAAMSGRGRLAMGQREAI
ncbi:MAG: hypothetical protein R2880_14620 [Deinococcales bacterium]